jgi:hypothetical protein
VFDESLEALQRFRKGEREQVRIASRCRLYLYYFVVFTHYCVIFIVAHVLIHTCNTLVQTHAQLYIHRGVVSTVMPSARSYHLPSRDARGLAFKFKNNHKLIHKHFHKHFHKHLRIHTLMQWRCQRCDAIPRDRTVCLLLPRVAGVCDTERDSGFVKLLHYAPSRSVYDNRRFRGLG